MRRVALVLGVAGALVLASAPAGAGGGDNEARITRAEIRKLREAPARTLLAGPRRYQIEVAITIPPDPPGPARTIIPFRAEGVVDTATGATEATFEVLSEPSGEVPDTELTVRAPSNDVTYLMSEAFTLPAGKQWVEVPTEQLKSAVQTTSALKYAGEFVGKPRVGSPYEARNGVKTTRYVVDVPIRTIIESGGAPADAATEKELKRLERQGLGNAPVNLYLDHDGRIVMYATFINTGRKLNEGIDLAITGEYYDFGAELDATPPPADQVVPADQVADQLEPFLGELNI